MFVCGYLLLFVVCVVLFVVDCHWLLLCVIVRCCLLVVVCCVLLLAGVYRGVLSFVVVCWCLV